jgi:pimeloyl-ACP methyl ester carboxylesterase
MSTRAGRAALCGLFYAHPGALAPADCVADALALVDAPAFAVTRAALGDWRLERPTSAPAPADVPAGAVAPSSMDRRDAAFLLDRIPVTIAWGTRDLVLPYRQAARARKVLPHARHVRLAGCGHLPFADDPDSCARLLLDAR